MVNIAIMLFTHRRPDYAERTLDAVIARMTNCYLHIHIADDDSEKDHRDWLVELARRGGRMRPGTDGVSVTHAGGKGYGGSYNAATNVVHQLPDIDAILPLEDDWELTRDWDPTPMVKFLKDGPARSIRLGYIGVTGSIDMRTHVHDGRIYLELHPRSNDPHVFAGHPRLETIQYERSVGGWPEGIDPGSTEFSVAHRDSARKDVYWPGELPLTGGLFAHIGTIQARTDQREAVADGG